MAMSPGRPKLHPTITSRHFRWSFQTTVIIFTIARYYSILSVEIHIQYNTGNYVFECTGHLTKYYSYLTGEIQEQPTSIRWTEISGRRPLHRNRREFGTSTRWHFWKVKTFTHLFNWIYQFTDLNIWQVCVCQNNLVVLWWGEFVSRYVNIFMLHVLSITGTDWTSLRQCNCSILGNWWDFSYQCDLRDGKPYLATKSMELG